MSRIVTLKSIKDAINPKQMIITIEEDDGEYRIVRREFKIGQEITLHENLGFATEKKSAVIIPFDGRKEH